MSFDPTVQASPQPDNSHRFHRTTEPQASRASTTPSPWWTVNEAADYLRCARVTVYRMIKSGRLRAKKCGRDWRTRQEWIDNGALLDVE